MTPKLGGCLGFCMSFLGKELLGNLSVGSVGRFELLWCLRMLCWKGSNSLLPAKCIHTNLGPGNHIDRGPPADRQIYGNTGFSKHHFPGSSCFRRDQNPLEQSRWTWPVCVCADRTSAGLVPTRCLWLCFVPLAPASSPSFCAEICKGVSCAQVGLEVITRH